MLDQDSITPRVGDSNPADVRCRTLFHPKPVVELAPDGDVVDQDVVLTRAVDVVRVARNGRERPIECSNLGGAVVRRDCGGVGGVAVDDVVRVARNGRERPIECSNLGGAVVRRDCGGVGGVAVDEDFFVLVDVIDAGRPRAERDGRRHHIAS